jgi:hypothetical protein
MLQASGSMGKSCLRPNEEVLSLVDCLELSLPGDVIPATFHRSLLKVWRQQPQRTGDRMRRKHGIPNGGRRDHITKFMKGVCFAKFNAGQSILPNGTLDSKSMPPPSVRAQHDPFPCWSPTKCHVALNGQGYDGHQHWEGRSWPSRIQLGKGEYLADTTTGGSQTRRVTAWDESPEEYHNNVWKR